MAVQTFAKNASNPKINQLPKIIDANYDFSQTRARLKGNLVYFISKPSYCLDPMRVLRLSFKFAICMCVCALCMFVSLL